MPYSADQAARRIATMHAEREEYRNLTGDLEPPTISDAYLAQEALVKLWEPTRGPVAGLKIATTTKVMQQLMGIDHPCGGMIYANTVHASPLRLERGRYQHVVVECELAVRLAHDLPATGAPLDRKAVQAAIGDIMAAFELIEDRFADYKTTSAKTLIADNAWNAGIVLGKPISPTGLGDCNGRAGRLTINGALAKQGVTDDPLGALAWVANLAIERGRPMRAGMVVITGSVIATLPIDSGDTFRFEIDGIPPVELTAT